MAKVKSLQELKKMREQMKGSVDVREKGENIDNLVQIKVAMATCGIAAGSRGIMNKMIDVVSEQKLDNIVVTQTGCMGYCYAEPTVEVHVPGREPVVFGEVDDQKAVDIIDKYVKNNELLSGIIPVNYGTVEE